MKKLRGCLSRVVIIGVSTLFTLFLLDAGLRVVQGGRIFSIRHRPDVQQVYRFPPNQQLSEVVDGDIRQPGDPAVQEWRVHWITDAFGYRNEAIPEVIDTLVLGDSFGSLPASQEALLATRLGECDRSVYNLSVSAHGPWQEYATLMLEQDRLQVEQGAALIWMLYSGNDMDDVYVPVYGDAIKTDLPTQGPGPFLFDYVIESPLLQLAFRVLDPRQTRVFDPKGRQWLYNEPYLKRAQRSADDIRALPNYAQLKDTFKALAEDAAAHGMKPLVVVIPSKEEVYYYEKASGFGEIITELAAENDLPVLDLTPDFMARAGQGEYLYYLQDTHWNDYAQQLVAGMICQQLGQER